MRNTTLTSDEIPETYSYNGTTFIIKDSSEDTYFNKISSESILGTNYNDWTTAGLQYFLNASDGYWGTISSNIKNKIDNNYTYYLGNVRLEYDYYNSSYVSDTIGKAYTHERSSTTCSSNMTSQTYTNSNCNIWFGNQATWQGAVALLYPSDYSYSANSNYWYSVINLNNTVHYTTSWIFETANSVYEWFLSPSSSRTTDVATGITQHFNDTWYVSSTNATTAGANLNYSTRPVINLLSTATFKDNGADGSINNPYILN